jgi:hypothetical protein
MTTAPVPSSPDAPHELLAGLRDLTRTVRAAQRGAWFPLLLLGLLLLGGILVDRLTFRASAGSCSQAPGGCLVVKQGSPLYWTLGFVLVYAATAVYYIRGSRERGVGSPVPPYVIAGIVIVALVAPTRFWDPGTNNVPGATVDYFGLHFHTSRGLEGFLSRLTGLATSIGLPLLVLAWVERNRALLMFTLAYLIVELVPVAGGRWNLPPTSPWSGAPHYVVPALLLLLGALGFALAQRPRPVSGGSEPAGPVSGVSASGGPA